MSQILDMFRGKRVAKSAVIVNGDVVDTREIRRNTALRDLFVSTVVLRDQTQRAHWEVTGAGATFSELHEMFGEQYAALSDAADEIAERIRQLRGDVPPTYGPDVNASGRMMLATGHAASLALGHERLSARSARLARLADEADDAATVDLASRRMAAHEKAAWFLRMTAGIPDEAGQTWVVMDDLEGERLWKTSMAKAVTRDLIGETKQVEIVESFGSRFRAMLAKAGGPFVGPKGGKWADAAHTQPWHDMKPAERVGAMHEAISRGDTHALVRHTGAAQRAGMGAKDVPERVHRVLNAIRDRKAHHESRGMSGALALEAAHKDVSRAAHRGNLRTENETSHAGTRHYVRTSKEQGTHTPVSIDRTGVKRYGPDFGSADEAHEHILNQIDKHSAVTKAAAPKYVKRIPTGNSKRPWRYFYAVQHGGGVHNQEHFQEGASFAHDGGHYQIHGVGADHLVVSHTSKPDKRVKMTHSELAAKLQEHHGKALAEHRAKLEKEHTEAVAAGNDKGAAKIRAEAAKVGHSIAEPKKPGVSSGAAHIAELVNKPDVTAATAAHPKAVHLKDMDHEQNYRTWQRRGDGPWMIGRTYSGGNLQGADRIGTGRGVYGDTTVAAFDLDTDPNEPAKGAAPTPEKAANGDAGPTETGDEPTVRDPAVIIAEWSERAAHFDAQAAHHAALSGGKDSLHGKLAKQARSKAKSTRELIARLRDGTPLAPQSVRPAPAAKPEKPVEPQKPQDAPRHANGDAYDPWDGGASPSKTKPPKTPDPKGKEPKPPTGPVEHSIDANSGNLSHTRWTPNGDGSSGTMRVRFKNGSEYDYHDVAFSDYEGVRAGAVNGSPGQSFNHLVKDKHKTTKVKAGAKGTPAGAGADADASNAKRDEAAKQARKEQVNERKESNNRPGATHTYGARRPIEYGSAPEGHVSRGKHDDFPHGTVSYDTELSDADRERYGLLKIPSEHDKHALAARVVDLAKDSKALPALYARGGSERVHNWLDAKAANIIEGSGIHAKSAEIAKLANEKLNERKAAPDLSEKIKSQPSAPPHAERNETAGKGDGTAAKEEKPESAKTAKSVDEHIATAAKTYGLSSEEADKLKSHPHVDTARKSPDKAEGYVRLAVKDHLSRDRKRNMSPSTAERFMREREKGEKIKKALGNIFAAIRGQRSAG